jgi:hypothetical protein
LTNFSLDVVFAGGTQQMTLVFPIGAGGTLDRLPADQTLKHRAHRFEAISLTPYPTCPRQVLFMERQIDDAWLFKSSGEICLF